MRDEELLKELWKDASERYNHPALNSPEIADSLDNPARFDYKKRKICVSRKWLGKLENVGMKRPISLKGLLDHETGHYVLFPRELSTQIYLLAEANRYFGDKGENIYSLYADLADEGYLLKEGLGDESLLELRGKVSEALGTHIEVDLNKLMLALYAHTFNFNPPELNEKEKKYFDKLKQIPYVDISLKDHEASMYRFGKIIEDLLPKNLDAYVSYNPQDGSLEEIPNKDLNRALSDILRELGPRAFKDSKDYVKKVRPGFQDAFEDKGESSKSAGLERSRFNFNDELIPLYKRWASTYGLYIAKRPFEKDSTSLYRSEKKEYEVGDPIHKIDIFGSREYVGIPGISKVYVEEEGTIPSVEWSIPHLNVGIDSSGSMDHPGARTGAPQVLAAFIMGKNYYANGSLVGGWNFSTDIAFLPPSRDLEKFYSLMCGYWGKGTCLNIPKLKEFLEKSEFGEKGIRYSDEKDYERMLSYLPKEKQREFLQKSLRVDSSKLKMKVKKMDNVLITDGYIANAEEVLDYLLNLGEITRNFVFLTDKAKYEEWSKISLPNTWIYLADGPEKLVGLALGRGRALVRESTFE